jgi:hypothetical protein
LQWALVWTLSRPRWFCKEAWAVAISAHRNQPLTNSVIRKVLLQESLNKRKRLAC